jgi:hypothetical protein
MRIRNGIIKLIIVLGVPLITALPTIIWLFRVNLETAITSLTSLISFSLPIYFIYLLIWIAVLSKTKVMSE